MIILALQEIRKSFGTHEVLKGVSFTLQEQDRMGLVGVNGCGKSTLMKIIAGEESADSGSVNIQKGLRIGYLAQQGELSGRETVREVLESVFEPLVRMEEEMRSLEQEMAEHGADAEMLRRLGGRYDALTREFERQNGYGWRSRVTGVLKGLKLWEMRDMETGRLSGGERTRLCLGRMLLSEPDLLRANPKYSQPLKARILGDRGHLSNEACAEALLRLVAGGTKNLILGHLSGENNTPLLARRVSEAAMLREGIRPGEDVSLQIALRDETGDIFMLKETED